MTITDEPMPGVGQLGDTYLIELERDGNEIRMRASWALSQVEAAKRSVLANARGHDEVVLVEATIVYRAWDRDKVDKLVIPATSV